MINILNFILQIRCFLSYNVLIMIVKLLVSDVISCDVAQSVDPMT